MTMADRKQPGGVTATHHNEKPSPTLAPYDESEGSVEVTGNADGLKRHLGNRQIQMIAVGGTVGTALFVSIGNGLINGGPGSLFLAYALYSALLGLVNNSMAEMAVFMPVSGTSAAGLPRRHTCAVVPPLLLTCSLLQAPSSDSPGNGLTRPLASCRAGTSTSTMPP